MQPSRNGLQVVESTDLLKNVLHGLNLYVIFLYAIIYPPSAGHHFTACFCVRFLAREGFVAFLITSSVIRLTSSCVYTSPRSDSPSLTRISSYSSALYSFSVIFSHWAAERNTEVARPFCVSMMGRCVSAVRATQSAGLQGQVCIASRGKVKKPCTEVKAGASADVFIRALRGSRGLWSL